MCIEDVGIATVVVNSQVSAILLEDITCFSFAFTADKFSNMAAFELINSFAPLLIVPGSSVLQEDIDCTIEFLIAAICRIAFVIKAVISDTGPFGICSCQAKVYFSVKLRLVSIYSTGRCTYIALQYQLVVSSAYCIVVFIKVNVHAGGTRFSNHCIIIMLVILINFDVTATVNRQLSMTAVGEQCVAVDFGIYITIDSNLWSHLHRIVAAAVYQGTAIIAISTFLGGQAPFAAFVTHSSNITVKGYFGIASCIQAQGITDTLHIELGITVDGQLHRFVLTMYALAYIDALNTTIGTAAVDYQLACINSYAVSRACAKCINSRAAFGTYIKRQSLACVNSCTLLQIYSSRAFSVNSGILLKFISSFTNNNICFGIFTVILFNTCQSSSEIGYLLVNKTVGSTLTVFFIKINTGCFQCF